MTVSDWIQLSILVVYVLQLTVLILGYFGIIREANKNARERQKAIDDAAHTFQSMVDRNKEELTSMAKRNMIGMSIISVLAALFLFADRYRITDRFKDKKP